MYYGHPINIYSHVVWDLIRGRAYIDIDSHSLKFMRGELPLTSVFSFILCELSSCMCEMQY